MNALFRLRASWTLSAAVALLSTSTLGQPLPSVPGGTEKKPPRRSAPKAAPPRPAPKPAEPPPPSAAQRACERASEVWSDGNCTCRDVQRTWDSTAEHCVCPAGTHDEGGSCMADAPAPPAPTLPQAPPVVSETEPEPESEPEPEPAQPLETEAEAAAEPMAEPEITAEPLLSEPTDASIDPNRGATQRTVGLVTAGLGAAALAVGAVYGLNAKSKEQDSEKDCEPDDPTICNHDGAVLIADAKRDAKVANIAFVGGGVAVLGGLLLYLLAPESSSGATAALGHEDGLRWSPAVGRKSALVTLGGRF